MTIPVPGIDETEAWNPSGGILKAREEPYTVTITEAEPGSTTKGGYPQLVLRLECGSGYIRSWQTITPRSIGIVRQLVESAGVKLPEGGDSATLDESLLVGRKIDVKVEKVPDQNNDLKDRVVAYFPPSKTTGDSTTATPAAPSASSDVPF